MPKEKKYVKLEAGERKAVRQSGAMKTARKTGLKTNIYSGERGNLFTSTSPKSTVPGATTRTKTTPSVDIKRQAASTESKEYNNAQYVQQGMINQKEFEKTRLGARMVRKADRAVSRIEKKGGEAPASRYTQGAPKGVSQKKQLRISGTVSDNVGSGLNKRSFNTMTKKDQAAFKKSEKEKTQALKREKKYERMSNKIARVEERGQRALERKNKRAAKKNS